ncbi:unnamed protein product [Alopecurus aequalis]
MNATSAAAAAAHPMSRQKMINAGSAVPNGTGGVAVHGTFAPSAWGDFFVTYVPPIAERSEEWMRDRAKELKRQVCKMFEDCEVMGVPKAVQFVDTLERLGLDSHFRNEIAAIITRIHQADMESPEFLVGSDNLHIAATRFRLLRQHGLWVPTYVFDKFKDGAGNFSASSQNLSSDPRALLSLYHAAHMAVPGEATLDNAIAFARYHLEAMKGNLQSPAAEQVSRALDHPLPRFTKQIETMHYIGEYAQEGTHDGTLLELAKINSNLMRSIHLKELKDLSLWWRDLYDAVNLKYSRDRVVEVYFWCSGMIPEEDQSRARLLFVKAFALVSILDDTFDVGATIEECHSFNEAMQRWDKSTVSIVPEYLRMLYIKTLSNFEKFEDVLEPHEKYGISYAKKAYQLQSEYHMLEAQWTNDKYQPSFEEHEELSSLSTALPMLILVGLMGYGCAVTTKELLEWTSALPDVVRAASKIGRFLNDVSSFKLGKNKKDVISAVECYMLEKGVSGDEAMAGIAAMTEENWRVVNKACIEVKPALLPAAQLAASAARACEVMYLRGRDGYTFGEHVKGLLTAFYLAPIPL